jgi:hypothetical protein
MPFHFISKHTGSGDTDQVIVLSSERVTSEIVSLPMFTTLAAAQQETLQKILWRIAVHDTVPAKVVVSR